ncbi:MAG: hypothetical protein HOW73_24350 [Polyangiaceae bacterium]|nr:hypothetical protein [Polyangiaceae bacterium]
MTRLVVLLVATTTLLGCSDDGSGGADSEGGGDAGGSVSAGGAGPSGCDGGPLAAPLPGCAPEPLASTGDPHQDCVDRINQLRWECQCLPPLARWTDAESCTDEQAASDQASGSPHAGFGACGEGAQNTCPNWGSAEDIIGGCLQGMWDEGPGEPYSEHGHYINMSNQGYSKVACGFATNGETWSNQNFY